MVDFFHEQSFSALSAPPREGGFDFVLLLSVFLRRENVMNQSEPNLNKDDNQITIKKETQNKQKWLRSFDRSLDNEIVSFARK
jgi:hypothetical protein